jgi:hypothetical protein
MHVAGQPSGDPTAQDLAGDAVAIEELSDLGLIIEALSHGQILCTALADSADACCGAGNEVIGPT